MGGTVVARIDGGTDVFELLVGRLQRHRQTVMTDDRWSVTIRSYRQPTPPVVEQSFKSFVDSTTNPHQRWDSQDIISSTGLKLRQRIMHTVRNSAGPEGLVVMIEDGNAPTRTNWETKLRERKIEISRRKITQATAIANSQPSEITNGVEGPIISAINQSETSNSMLDPLTLIEKEESIKNISTALESSSVLLDDGDGFVDLPPEPPNHFRVTMASFPDSFEQLLSNSLVTSQPDPNPSLWIARSQTIWIHGSIWGLYSTHLGLNNSKSDPDSLTLDGQTPPDYWIRLGKVVNKGASNSSVSLPWAILEVECVASPEGLSTTSTCAESVINLLLEPRNQMVTVKPFCPTPEDLFDTGLYVNDHTQNHGVASNHVGLEYRKCGYSMLMLAKREGLI